jgi:hypothetical protein
MSEAASTAASTAAPADDLQKEIARLKAENQKLAKDLAGAHDDLKDVRGEARDRRHETKTLKEQLDALTKERDEYKGKAEADPEGLKAQLAELTGKIRERAHRDTFAEVASAARVTDPARIADLYALSGYKPEGDEADTAKLGEIIGAALKSRPHFLDPPPAGAGNAAAGAAGANGTTQSGGKPGPGADRGQSTSTDSSSQPRERIPGRL